MSNKRFDILNRIDEIPSASYLVLGILFLTLHTVVCKYTEVSPTSFGILCIFLYLLSATVVWIFLRKKIAIYRAEAAASDGSIDDVIVPAELRQRICAAVYMLMMKNAGEPRRKHCNLPL